MTIEEVMAITTELKKKVAELEAMAEDFNVCKSQTSKTYLLAAMSKMAAALSKEQTQAR